MISRPILTKKIKRNNTVYNLELWNTTDDEPQYIPTRNASGQFEPPSFKKDFFNDIAMNGTWPDAVNAAKYQERFDSWFDNLPLNKQKQYARAIDESNRIIITMVWDIINPIDKQELFNNNLRQFSNWFSGLEVPDIDFYMTRIMSKQRLMPEEFNGSGEILTEEQITQVLEEIYDRIDDDLIRATTINGLLCISCTNETRLQKAKKHMVRNGSILRDYRKKENSNGRTIYTYIFSKP